MFAYRVIYDRAVIFKHHADTQNTSSKIPKCDEVFCVKTELLQCRSYALPIIANAVKPITIISLKPRVGIYLIYPRT